MGVDLPNHPAPAFWKVQHELSNHWMLAVYVIAMLAVCFHFAYGVWLFAAKWGIIPGETPRRRFGWVCAAGGVLLAAMGIASIWAFVDPKYANAPQNPQLSYQRTEIRDQAIGTRVQELGTSELKLDLDARSATLVVRVGESVGSVDAAG
jgi:hypothetical protein